MGGRGTQSKLGNNQIQSAGGNIDSFYTQSREDLIEDLARQMTTEDYDSRLDNGDMQSMAELYAEYNGLDDNAIIDAVRNRAEELQNAKNKTLTSKSQVDELTKDFTPDKFMGNLESKFNNTTLTLKQLEETAEQNMPNTLNVGGYTFKSMGKPQAHYEMSKSGRAKHNIMMDYQSTEKIGNEYPVLQVGVRVWSTPKGKVKSEIIRDGVTYKTRFW